jgi:hypothetical protein
MTSEWPDNLSTNVPDKEKITTKDNMLLTRTRVYCTAARREY